MAKRRVEPYKSIHRSRKDMLINNFLGGIAWGIGNTVVVGIILIIVGYAAKHTNIIPYVGNFVTEIVNYVNAHQ